ncbi:MAG: hypothetical protein LQ352_001013 [Teloschistes flavicans]|nr:MAG: hypothetical protein LQ352_001013 [Teloschistes flavicans]
MAKEAAKHRLVDAIRQSPPFDVTHVPDDSWVKDKVIVITGAASGFGAGFLTRWAAAGAVIVAADINVVKGDQLVRDVKRDTGNSRLYFVHCDVTEWQSQVNLFRQAVKFSPHGGIDTVVANAGIAQSKGLFEYPQALDVTSPPPPDLSILNVNLTGVTYTAHLALWYLQRNPGSSAANPKCVPSETHRDRHLLLMASVAGLMAMPGGALYNASKHAVVGLYRSLRSSSFVHGVRVNLICPYFIDTSLVSVTGRAILAGGTIGKVEDVVEAATRFAANPRVVGRAVSVGPKLKVKQNAEGEWSLVEGEDNDAEQRAIWEVYMHDFEDADIFQRRLIAIFNRVVEIRGWTGWVQDLFAAVTYRLRSYWT